MNVKSDDFIFEKFEQNLACFLTETLSTCAPIFEKKLLNTGWDIAGQTRPPV